MWLSVPCITIRDETEWVKIIEAGWNVLCSTDPEEIIEKVSVLLCRNANPEALHFNLLR